MTPERRTLLRLEVPLGIFGAALVALAVTFAVVGIPAWIPPAPLVRFGVPSPLTGMTRSFVAMASMHVPAAFAWHPLGPLVFAACAALPIVATAAWVRGARFEFLARVLRSRTLWFAVGLLFAVAWARQTVLAD